MEDAECLRASLSVGIGTSPGFMLVSMSLTTSGVWVEPMGLLNFAIADPQLSFTVQIPTTVPTVPIPRALAWAVTIYYKPDIEHKKSNWPAELTAPRVDGVAPVIQVTDKIRSCSSYFLYEQWSPTLDDPILKLIGLPRFAVKLVIPELSLMDMLLMYADVQVPPPVRPPRQLPPSPHVHRATCSATRAPELTVAPAARPPNS